MSGIGCALMEMHYNQRAKEPEYKILGLEHGVLMIYETATISKIQQRSIIYAVLII